MNTVLQNRTYSGFPVSIGTGLSLETIFDPITEVYDKDRIAPSKVNKKSYNLYLFNVSTIIRNILSTVTSKDLISIKEKELLEVTLEEIEWLDYFFSSNDLKVTFYVNKYEYIKKTYNNSNKLRKPSTEKQVYTDKLMNYSLRHIEKQDDTYMFNKDIAVRDSIVTKCLVFTHIPFDLLSWNKYLQLDLLESNTGLVKTRKNWNSKYFKIPDRDMSILPFTEYLLVTFGDNVMFHPSSLHERLELYDTISKLSVNPLTSEDALMLKLGKRT